MCVAFWTLDHPDYALILCANRDEFLARPTRPAAFHSFGSDGNEEGRVLSGRDTQAGGTWLGLAPASGRVALLTNITEPPQSLSSSRGALCPTFLLADADATLEELYPPAAQYAGFNLLVLAAEWEAGADARLHFPYASLLSNGGGGGLLSARPLRPEERACGGLSNGVDGKGADAWPKVAHGRALFAAAAAAADSPRTDGDDADAQDAALAARLFALLRTPPAAPVRVREELRRAVCVAPLTLGGATAAPLAREAYATRLATVLLVRRSGAARFAERDVWVRAPDGGVLLSEPGAGERLWRVQVGAEAPAPVVRDRNL
ncbi:NRDE protein-domain-containing protein [Mycena rosella]|uniref:NRDE protein-domain-containing protein n=1 Tax=Mycena rosella TaxID=1033263 RepID=A0AAD7GIM0_MYCRO|nr:NRDE protein-domain-containing protein [Mycena rosella]